MFRNGASCSPVYCWVTGTVVGRRITQFPSYPKEHFTFSLISSARPEARFCACSLLGKQLQLHPFAAAIMVLSPLWTFPTSGRDVEQSDLSSCMALVNLAGCLHSPNFQLEPHPRWIVVSETEEMTGLWDGWIRDGLVSSWGRPDGTAWMLSLCPDTARAGKPVTPRSTPALPMHLPTLQTPNNTIRESRGTNNRSMQEHRWHQVKGARPRWPHLIFITCKGSHRKRE